MRERFKQWPPKLRVNKRWLVGAIAVPALLWLWLGPISNRRHQLNDAHQSHNDSETLARQRRDTIVSSLGTIAAVVGGVFLFLNCRTASGDAETVNLSGADLSDTDLSDVDFSGADLNGANLSGANLKAADLSGADLNWTFLGGANLSKANLSGANLNGANLSGASLSGADLRYANLSGANLRYTNLSDADLRYANLSGADLNCALLSGANFSDTNLSGALLFYLNSREALNLEPIQLEAKPSPFLCNVALPSYSKQPKLDPYRDCARIPELLSDRYDISLEEAEGIVEEALQHTWD